MNKPTKLFPVVALLLTCNAFAQNDPFRSPKYKVTSSDPLIPGEKTLIYTYPNNPCGTLMTEFSARGSVGLGRGPVYRLMLIECQKADPNSYPDDNSVRTYACRNVATKVAVLGKATFAFQCLKGEAPTKLH